MFIIKDWASNILNTKGLFQYTAYGQLNDVNPKIFESFDDAWAWIYMNVENEDAFQDLFVEEL